MKTLLAAVFSLLLFVGCTNNNNNPTPTSSATVSCKLNGVLWENNGFQTDWSKVETDTGVYYPNATCPTPGTRIYFNTNNFEDGTTMGIHIEVDPDGLRKNQVFQAKIPDEVIHKPCLDRIGYFTVDHLYNGWVWSSYILQEQSPNEDGELIITDVKTENGKKKIWATFNCRLQGNDGTEIVLTEGKINGVVMEH